MLLMYFFPSFFAADFVWLGAAHFEVEGLFPESSFCGAVLEDPPVM